jgi:Protein of unknown function (DUF3606)
VLPKVFLGRQANRSFDCRPAAAYRKFITNGGLLLFRTESFGTITTWRQLVPTKTKERIMPKQSTRGRQQDRARVAGGQNYEVRYEAKKTRQSPKAVKRAVKKVGNNRKRVDRELSR